MTGSQEDTSDLSSLSATPSRYLVLTEKQLSSVVNLVMEQALNEKYLPCTYVRLCYNFLSELWATKINPDDGRVQWISFREVLLRKCRSEFERGRAPETRKAAAQLAIERKRKLEAARTEQEREFDAVFYLQEKEKRRRALGLMRFFGGLYTRSIMSFRMIDDFLCELIMDPTDADSIQRAYFLLQCIVHEFAADPQGRKKGGSKLMEIFHKLMVENPEAQKKEDGLQQLPPHLIYVLERVSALQRRSWELPRPGRRIPIHERVRVTYHLLDRQNPYESISMLLRGGIGELWERAALMVPVRELPYRADQGGAPAA